jgi:tetratricopeptide (TPR) repeat protein
MIRLTIVIPVILVFFSQPARADLAATHYHKAMAQKRQGKLADAIGSLKKALEVRGDYAAAHRSIAILYRKKKNYEKAVFHGERAVALQPESAETLYSLALCYHYAGRKDDARSTLKKAAKLKPDDPQIRFTLGVSLIRRDPAEALPHLQAAVKAMPNDADYLHQLGLAHRKMTSRLTKTEDAAKRAIHYKKAEQHLERAAALKPSAALEFDLGVLYRRTDRALRAITHYEKAIKLKPTMKAAYWDLGMLYKIAKRYDDSVKAFEKYLSLSGGKGKDADIARMRMQEARKAKGK